MKKLLLLVSAILIATAGTVLALDPDPYYENCVSKGFVYENDDQYGEICVFPDEAFCPVEDFYDEECGEDYWGGLFCDSPMVPYQNECVDPIPACIDWPEGAVACIDKIVAGQYYERFTVVCYDGWELVEQVEDVFGEVTELAYCENPCDDPLIPIEGECIDPFPACQNPPENSVPSSCIDKISYDGSESLNYEFQCMEGYYRDGDECVEGGIVCTEDAKICDDGSSVGRVGPDCEFALCPEDKVCKYDGEYYPAAAGFPDADGCNSCTCMENGEVACTLMECIEIESVFEDMETDHPNYMAIEFLYEEEVINGYPDGTFQPEKTVNRAELMKIVVEGTVAEGDFSPSDEDSCFDDVPAGEWFTKYICHGKKQGWIEGYSDGTFKPEQTVNKVEAIKILLEVYGVELDAVDEAPFIDVPTAEWFAPYIVTAKNLNILEEKGDYLIPDQGMRRAGISQNLYNLLTRAN